MEQYADQKPRSVYCNGLDADSRLGSATGWDWPLRFPKFCHARFTCPKKQAFSFRFGRR